MAALVPLSVLYHVAKRLPAQRIGRDNDPYLDRFYLGRTKGITFYLHRFLRADHVAEGMHNHPWPWGRSLLLNGSYLESRKEVIPLDADDVADTDNFLVSQKSMHWVRFYNHLGNDTFHRVEELSKREVWTLFWHPNWRRRWGFLTPTGFRNASGRLDGVAPKDWWETSPTGERYL